MNYANFYFVTPTAEIWKYRNMKEQKNIISLYPVTHYIAIRSTTL